MRTLTELNVPRRIAWRVMTPNQVSIWLSQEDPTGVKWNSTFGFFSSHSFTSGVVWVERLSQYDVNLLTGVRLDRLFEERQEGVAVAAGPALTDDLTGPDVQRGEQVCRAVPNVVVGALLGGVERDRQQRLGPVQRLDLRLLVHTEDDRPGRRVEVEPDNVGHLVRERRVLADLEGTLLVRLQPGL